MFEQAKTKKARRPIQERNRDDQAAGTVPAREGAGRRWRRVAVVALLIVVAAGAAAYWWVSSQSALPAGIAFGNGRIEAEEIDIAAKYPGRVADVSVNEGDTVRTGDVLARMDTREQQASLRRAQAQLRQAREARRLAEAEVRQRRSELTFANQELGRAKFLVQKGHVSKERLDRRVTEQETAAAAMAAARARLADSNAAIGAAAAEVERIQAAIDEGVLQAPRDGRVQYRLAQPGEVLAAGGKVLTLLDLTDVYMTIFLPTGEAGRAAIGAEARIVLDAVPELVIPAKVSFVAARAQFTPKEVETRSEREKLMFRIKIKIDPALLKKHADHVKTGLPGVGYVRLDRNTPWPDDLSVRLPQ